MSSNDITEIFTKSNINNAEDYLKNLDVCIFFQGGSAMIESIQSGVPVILVSDKKCPIFNEPYIEFPKNIVPKVDIKDLVKFILDKNYLNNLLKKHVYNENITIDSYHSFSSQSNH